MPQEALGSSVLYYTPSEIEDACRHSLNTGFEREPILVRGVFEDLRGKSYSPYYPTTGYLGDRGT